MRSSTPDRRLPTSYRGARLPATRTSGPSWTWPSPTRREPSRWRRLPGRPRTAPPRAPVPRRASRRLLPVSGFRLRVLSGGLLVPVLLRHLSQRRDLVPLVEVHDAHALGVAADLADLVRVGAVDHPLRGDEHDVVAVADADDADHRAVALGRADVAQPLAAPALLAVAHPRSDHALLARRLVGRLLRRLGRLLGLRLGRLGRQVGAERRPLAVAVLAHRQQVTLRVGHDHADDVVAVGQVDALDAPAGAAHRPGVGLVEADGHALAGAEHYLVARLRQRHVDEAVALLQVDADDAALLGPAVRLEGGLLHQAVACRHHQVAVGVEAAHRDDAADLLVGPQR